MNPYGITPEAFADISALQNALMQTWYSKIDGNKMDILSVASFLQETGKIIIAQELIKEGRASEFRAALANGSNITDTEREFIGETTATVTAAIFEHWRFEEGLVEAIKYSDAPLEAPEEIAPYSKALCVVKTALQPLNTFSEEHLKEACEKAAAFGLGEKLFRETMERFRERKVS